MEGTNSTVWIMYSLKTDHYGRMPRLLFKIKSNADMDVTVVW